MRWGGGALNRAVAWLAARRQWQRMGIAALAGALSVLAMPPFGIWPLLWVTYPVLIWLLDGVKPHASERFAGWVAAGATAWAFGFGFFLVGLYWIGSAFLVEADAFAWMIPFVALILPGGLGLFFAGAAIAARAVARRGAVRVLAYVAAFVLAEWLRGHVLTGFPWNALGYGLSVSGVMVQTVSLWGLYGQTLVAALIATAPAMLAGPGCAITRRSIVAVGLLAAALPLGLVVFGMVRLAAPEPDNVPGVALRIVQPNIAQKDKWRPELRAANFARLLQLSRGNDNLAGVTHVIWPESAPPFVLADNPDARTLIAHMLPSGVHLITGGIRLEALPQVSDNGRWARFFNSVMVLDDEARIGAIYDKAHLVPIGEYLPAQSLLEAIGLQQLTRQRGGYDQGPGPRTIPVPGAPDMSPLICYEVIFPGNVVGRTRPGWLLNATNDAWFGDSIGPRQHLYQARMRAVEEGLPIIRAANTGISAVIGPLGKIHASIDINKMGILDASLPEALPQTVYSSFGDEVFWVMWASLVLTIFVLVLRKV